MPLIGSPQTLETALEGDALPVVQLRAAFAAQRAAFNLDRMPSIEQRKARLQQLIEMMLNYRARISAALSEDFACHPVAASDLIEVLGPVARAQYAIEQLGNWMRPEERKVDPAMMGTAQAFIESQPKGVIGNIVPWNFPFDLSIGPMTEMLAAGNRVIVKPSELAPACAALLHEMVSKTFDETLVYVAVGGIRLAREFSHLPWDHLLYTGSTDIGREVMRAAARNLTPVTLELGGKCPAVLTPGSVNATNIESIIGTKTVKNGQMCISVDYCLVARDEVESFVQLARDFMQNAAENYSRSADCTGIISPRHFDRLSNMLQEARDRGSQIVELEPHNQADRATRRMPISLVINPAADLRVMREEIFGPILPLLAYDDVDQAIAMINSGERPLGVYVFAEDRHLAEAILSQITSGGAAINCCAIQGALPSLGFGGTGASGMGRHHGGEGFREFSNQRGVVVRGAGDQFNAFCAPYAKAAALVKAALS